MNVFSLTAGLFWGLAFVLVLLQPLVTGSSLVMALVWFNLFLLGMLGLTRSRKLILLFGLTPLLTGIAASLVRLVVPIGFPFAIEIRSRLLYPALRIFFGLELFRVDGVPFTVLAALLLVWAAGALIGLIGFFRALWRLERSLADLPESADTELQAAVRRVTGRDVPVVTAGHASPCTAGFFRPVIFLPELDYTAPQLDLVLRHEWQHIRGRDGWIKLILELLGCIFWWDPLVHLLRRRSDAVLELRCDFGVLGSLEQSRRLDYYETILAVARQTQGRPMRHTSALLGPSGRPAIVERFEVGLDYAGIQRRSYARSQLLCLLILLFFVLSYVVVFREAEPLWTLFGFLV